VIVLGGCDIFGRDMEFERGSQRPQMEVAVDAAITTGLVDLASRQYEGSWERTSGGTND
jgi:hypothetical protein